MAYVLLAKLVDQIFDRVHLIQLSGALVFWLDLVLAKRAAGNARKAALAEVQDDLARLAATFAGSTTTLNS